MPPEDPVAPHLLPDTAGRSPSGGLTVGGCELVELADRFGTPLFVYDEEHLVRRCREAVTGFGEGRVAYATKAFLCKAMATVAVEAGMLLDVSTGGELAVALAAGVPGDRLVLHGNNKSPTELADAVRVGVGRLVVDSFDEIDRLAALPLAVSGRPPLRVLVRVTPGVEAHTHAYVRTGQEDTKFGFSLASGAADEAVGRLRAIPGVELAGAHAHVGSQIFRTDVFAAELAVLAPFVLRHEVGECCVGGGLGVAYLNDETAPTLTDWSATIRAACAEVDLPPDVVVTAEPGRAVVASAAVTLYRVGTLKHLPGIRTYVAVDGGMSDNPRPVLYGSGYEAFLPRAPEAPRPLRARVVGKHCESGDVLVEEAHLPEDVAVGDVLATPVTGAYGYSMASHYNRLPRPAVIFVRDGAGRLVLRRETPQDMLQLEA